MVVRDPLAADPGDEVTAEVLKLWNAADEVGVAQENARLTARIGAARAGADLLASADQASAADRPTRASDPTSARRQGIAPCGTAPSSSTFRVSWAASQGYPVGGVLGNRVFSVTTTGAAGADPEQPEPAGAAGFLGPARRDRLLGPVVTPVARAAGSSAGASGAAGSSAGAGGAAGTWFRRWRLRESSDAVMGRSNRGSSATGRIDNRTCASLGCLRAPSKPAPRVAASTSPPAPVGRSADDLVLADELRLRVV